MIVVDLLQRAGAHRLPVPHVDEGAVCGVMQPALVGAAGTPVQRLRPQVRAVQRRQMRVARQHDRELVLVEYVLVLAGIVALQDAPAGLCLLPGPVLLAARRRSEGLSVGKEMVSRYSSR